MQITQATIENNKPLEGNVYIERENTIYSDIKVKLEEIINNINSQNSTVLDEINNKFLELDFASEFDVDAAKIGVQDAIFFVNLLNQNQIINYDVKYNEITLSCNDKPIAASKSLINMLSASYEAKKPIRLDFDKDVTVILKLDNKGKLQVHFIPGSPEVESYLKTNIPSLKQIFDDENINYSHLGYSSSKENNKDNPQNSKKQKRSNQ